ncbi:MAG: exo-beta-N-acetylmuramidase NamZ domain-containing protein [Bryobacteraceae bacterium]
MKASQTPLRGVVHDPTARYMGGIAGHAGLFSTADDLSKFAEMMLGMGERNGVRVLSPLAVRAYTSPQSPPGQPLLRGLGWDIDSPYSGTRGDLFPVGSYGHTGFTGTSLWMDPYSQTYVILLSNAVHPRLRPAITPLRGKIANAAAAGLHLDSAAGMPVSARLAAPVSVVRTTPTLTGIDVLAAENFVSLKGKRVGLITNHPGITREGKRNIDVMLAGGVALKAIYSPEHGIGGKEDREKIGNGIDASSGLPVWSLYSDTKRKPSEEMLRDIDVIVFDIQDVGSRFYTYVCTMVNAMDEAAKRGIPFIVLDRPNPITGSHVEGPMLDASLHSFIGCIDMPIRHGMTVGELARMVNAKASPKTKLQVIKMKNWSREDWLDATGLMWVDPSPNMRSLNAALLYPGVGMLEGAKLYSVGRGTDAPFEQIGATWIKGRDLAQYLNARNIPGIRVYPTLLRPTASNFAGKTIEGVRFVVTARDSFDSVRFGLELGSALQTLFPGQMDWKANENLVGNMWGITGLSKATAAVDIMAEHAHALELFKERRAPFLLY